MTSLLTIWQQERNIIMAGRPKGTEKSPVAKAFAAAKEANKQAKAKLSQANTPQNQNAAKHAADKLVETTKAMNRERFLNVGGTRVSKSVAALNNLAKVANTKSYAFGEPDIKKAMEALTAAMAGVKSAFENALKTGGDKKTAAGTFKFE